MPFPRFWQRKLPIRPAIIEQTITQIEQMTSAEIRVVIERKTNASSAQTRAEALFNELGMANTAARNGVLLYLAFEPHYLAVIGDAGIDQHVGHEVWQDIYQTIKSGCQQGDYTYALCLGVQQLGKILAYHFPIAEGEVNELSNEVMVR